MLVNEELVISSQLQLTDCPLSPDLHRQVLRDTQSMLRQKYGIMQHVTEPSIVRQNKHNYINIRIKREYVNTVFIWTDSSNSMSFCFIASDKLEPVIIVVVIDHDIGRLTVFPTHKTPSLATAIDNFCSWTGYLDPHTLEYTYTDNTKRSVDRHLNRRCHSAHFHLKIHVKLSLYRVLFPAYNFTNIAMGLDNGCNSVENIDQMQYVQQMPKLKWMEVR